MKITFYSSKALEEIDGEWYIMDLDEGSIFNRKHVFSWLNKYNAYRLSAKELADIQRSNLFKSSVPIMFACGMAVFLGRILKGIHYVVIKTSYPMKVLLLMLSFYLIWLLIKKSFVWDKKKLDRILNKEIEWDTKVSIHFYSKKERMNYILFLTFTRLLVVVILLILGIVFFFVKDLLLGYLMPNTALFIILLPNRLPRRFYYTCERLYDL